jgi:probable rRNA maturation factor
MPLAAADRAELKRFARTLGEKIAGAGFFTCLITNDGELQLLNRSFLGRDYPTDVLSFPAGECGGTLGEIAISLERAQAQAAAFGHSCVDEIRILMLHGFLHLTGLDHERDRGEMARLEGKWRTVFGLPSTLIGRSRQGQGALA